MLASRSVSLAGLLCLIVAPAAALAAESWTGFRGPDTTGAVAASLPGEGSGTLDVAWRAPLGSGYSALAVGDGRIVTMFAAGDADVAAAFDAATGKELWRYRIGDMHAGHDGSHDGPISTPRLGGDRVFGVGPRGVLFSLDAATGAEAWRVDLVETYESKPPYYGFTTSPLYVDGMVIVMIGAGEGKTVAGFDASSGELRWSVGNDVVEYHSPVLAELGGRPVVLASGQKTLLGLDPATGAELFSYTHEGDERAMGGMTIVPVAAGPGRVFMMNTIDGGIMLSIGRDGDDWSVEEAWSSNALARSYVTPVYHDGYIYGMNNRIFACVDATTGEIVWRSREPGDGFPILVGDDIVMVTKAGSVHLIDATPEGYREIAGLEVFDDNPWSEAAYWDGALFVRGMHELARLQIAGAGAGSTRDDAWVAGTSFGAFLAELAAADDPGAAIDAWMERQSGFPVIDRATNSAHFVFRGDAQDVGIVGDLLGARREEPLTRVPGTDLFHFSMRFEPDAAMGYGFIVDYADEATPDPLNPRVDEGLFGEVSWFAMPGWVGRHGAGRAPEATGRMETHEWTSTVREEPAQRRAEVWLPPGYDDGDRRYPVLYVHNGNAALERGQYAELLDRTVGSWVEPLIAVFVVTDEENPRDLRDVETYTAMIVDELVPAIDATYRTIAEPAARATFGAFSGADVALLSGFSRPDVFGRIGARGATVEAREIAELGRTADEHPLVLHVAWGTYHLRSPHEAWDLAEENRRLWRALRDAGYRPAGGEEPLGIGWAQWSGRDAEALRALFPPAD